MNCGLFIEPPVNKPVPMCGIASVIPDMLNRKCVDTPIGIFLDIGTCCVFAPCLS